MKTIGRIVTRLQGENDGLFIGVMMKDQSLFKPNTIYELVDVMGTVMFKEVGQATGAGPDNCATNNMSEGKTQFHWAQDIGYIIGCYGQTMFLTADELNNLNSQNAK